MARRRTKKITADYLHNAGLYYLQRFSSSAQNFRRVMTRKIDRSCKQHEKQDRAECLQLLEETIARFKETGLLNDTLYAETAVRSLRRKGASEKAIRMKLRDRGLSPDYIAAALENGEQENPSGESADIVAAARYIRRRKLGCFSNKTDERRKEKEMAALARAGFGYDTACRILVMGRDEVDCLATGSTGASAPACPDRLLRPDLF